MHVKELLHKVFSESSIHLGRLKVFLLACNALLEGNKLTVTGLGRSIGVGKVKHNINKMNRLIGNKHLYEDRIEFYRLIAASVIGSKTRPVILVDWSSATPGERYQLLRASLAGEGRSITIYDKVHELSEYNNEKVHNQFLDDLEKILPAGCSPIIITDAGFSVPWFVKVKKLGWDFVGRISNTSHYWDKEGVKGKIRDLLTYNSAKVKRIGEITLTKKHQFNCYLQLYKKTKKERVRKTINGERSARSVSVKAAQREGQPWIIVSSLGKTYMQAQQVIKLYRLRMQIEESFRDLKSHQFGMGFEDSRTQGILRLSNLLLISSVTSLMGWLIGLSAKNKKMHYELQANSIKTRNVLSVLFIAREIVRLGKHYFEKKEWTQAFLQLEEYINCV